MSLSVSRSIVTSRTHLKTRLDEAVKLIAQTLPSSVSELENLRDNLLRSAELLERSIDTIRKSEVKWLDLIDQITDKEEKKAESDRYFEASTAAEGGFSMFLEHAEDCIASLSSRVRLIDREVSRRSNISTQGASSSTTPAASPQPTAPTVSQSKTYSVKPPKLTLQEFDGDVMKWKSFWGIFKANIHDNPDFSGVIKFSYLLPLLKGPARDAVSGLHVSDEHYLSAVNTLLERFDRSDDRMMSLLFGEFKKLSTAAQGCQQTRKTFDSCEAIFRQMSDLGEDVDLSRTMSLDYLSKFHDSVFRHLERDYGITGNSKLGEIRAAVKKYVTKWEVTSGTIQDLHTIAGTRSGSAGGDRRGSPSKPPPKGPEGSIGPEPTSSLGAIGGGKPNFCMFCRGKHNTVRCEQVPTLKDKLKRLKELGKCEKCAFMGHRGGKCFMADKSCDYCHKIGHAWLVCPDRKQDEFPQVKNPGGTKWWPGRDRKGKLGSGTKGQEQNGGSSDLACASPGNTSLFQTARVSVVNPETGGRVDLRLCIDTLSGRSYMTNDAAQRLKLQSSGSKSLRVSVFGSDKKVQVPSKIVEFDVQQKDGSMKRIVANTTKLITGASVLPSDWPSGDLGVVQSLKCSGALADDPFDPNGTVDILIGADYAWDFILGAKIPSGNNIYLIPTTLGMMLAGRLAGGSGNDPEEDFTTACMLCLTDVSGHLPSDVVCATQAESKVGSGDVDELMKLENVGIYDCPFTDDDEVALKKFTDTVYYKDGRYEVTWPWIEEKRVMLPKNKVVAEKRFRSLVTTRLQTSPKLLDTYRSVIKQQFDSGVIERVPEEELEKEECVHYLPHHPFVDLNRASTKVRIVYDASSRLRRSDLSLNECMYKGPTMLPDMCQLLMRFRTSPVAVTSDVEKAFLQVSLQPAERDYTRFLWFQDDSKPTFVKDNVIEYRFCRVLFGVISSPFLLAATIQHHLQQEDTEFAKSLADDIYVDNVISGLTDEVSATGYYQSAKSTFQRAGMNLQQFYSNSGKVMAGIPEEDKWMTESVKVLGLHWYGESDTICVKMSVKWNRYPMCTKRVILTTIASIYDPLGLFQPAVFPAKVFLQKLWIRGVAWDTVVTGEIADQWAKLKESLLLVFDHRIPRFSSSPNQDSMLVTFCDASKEGYGAAVFLWVPGLRGTVDVQLMFSKSRLSPIGKKGKGNGVTIPRLELLAVEIGCRITDFCREALRRPKMPCIVFTDSMVVLHWLRINDLTTLKRFVSGRIEKIRSFESMEFRHVGTTENPADLLSRGMSASDLLTSDIWWYGPVWLRSPLSDWPIQREQISGSESAQMSSESRVPETKVMVTVEPDTRDAPFGLDPESFDSWDKLLYRTAVCLIAVKSLLRQRNWTDVSVFRNVSVRMPPAAGDIEVAERLWIKWSQDRDYGDILDHGGPKNNLVQQLGLVVDEAGVIRACGRLRKSDLSEDRMCPILVSPKSQIAGMIVRKVHAAVGHAGESHTLSQLRLRFWIPKGLSFVRQSTRKCLICKRRKSKKVFRLPDMPQLPKERVSRSVVFQFVGLDYFGPIKVKLGGETRKMWVALFTCLATRAIHLEPVYDCSTVEFMHALIRFVSRRGCPHQIISDNAAQFKLTDILQDRAWKRLPTDEAILRYAANNRIRWKFIAELAPWQGGHYERLVGVVKSVLRVAIGRRLLTWTDMVTLLCETEAIVNSRPITYVPSDVDSQGKVLRPVDFLTPLDTGIGLSDTAFPVRDLGDAAKHLSAAWKKRKIYLDRLWESWYGEYLSALRNRSRNIHRQGRSVTDRSPREGEVVILKDEDLPRGSWKMAVITKLIEGADKKIRSVEVRLANGVRLTRAVNFLVPLEIGHEEKVDSFVAPDMSQGDDEDEFFGFTPSDIRRTELLIRAHDD